MKPVAVYILTVFFIFLVTADGISLGYPPGPRVKASAAQHGDTAGIPAADSSAVKKEKSWSFNGYVKDMQTVIIHTLDQPWVTNNLIHNRNNFKWNISESFTFCLQERNRFYWGELTAISPQYPDFIAYDNGLVNMSWKILNISRRTSTAPIFETIWVIIRP